jgi:hypothetical protein
VRGALGRTGCCGSHRHHHRHLELDQLGRQVGEPLDPPLRPTVHNDEVLAFDIAELTQPLPEGVDRGVAIRAGKARTEPPDPLHFPRWLCVSDKRRHEDTEGKGDNDPLRCDTT